MIAALDLVRIYLQHAPKLTIARTHRLPTFEDFRGTMELLDRRSKAFVTNPPTSSADCAASANRSNG